MLHSDQRFCCCEHPTLLVPFSCTSSTSADHQKTLFVNYIYIYIEREMPYERLDEMVILVAFFDSLVKELALL